MNYYNEYDRKTAAWLRELIKAGAIPDGHVDERSIADVQPTDLAGYTQCHFFAGIGGWSYALQLAGWPSDRPVWTGSCPCQPFSAAGKGLAQADERHLWPVFFDLIRQCRPEHVFGEQVASAIGHGWLDGVSSDLEAEGYACGATVLGAHSVNSPHQRQRLYWVAHSESARRRQHARAIRGATAEGVRKSEGQDIWRTEWEAGRACNSSAVDGLDDARRPSDERRGELGNVGRTAGEEQGEARQRQRSGDADSDSVQDDCGLVLSDCDGCSQRGDATTPAGYRNPANAAGCGIDWVAHTNEKRRGKLRRCQGQKQPDADKQPTDGGSFWSEFTLVHCRDGKIRRVPTEPAFFPLAHGIPARVVRLRGYGNAIVPECAKIFIEAFLDIQK